MATREEQIAALRQLFSGGLGALTPELFGDGGEGSGYQVGYRTPDTLYPLMQQARSILAANWNDPTLQWMSKLQGSNVVSGLSRPWDDSAGYGDWLLGAGDDATAPQRFRTVDELAAALAPGGATVSLPAMDDPFRPGKRMQYVVSFNPDGSLNNVDWRNVELSGGWLTENGWMIPLAAIGYAAAPALFGGAGAAAPAAESAAAAGGAAGGTGLSAGASGLGLQMPGAAGLGAMGGGTGLVAPGGFVLAPQLGAAAAGGAAGAAMVDPSSGGYFGGLDPAAGGQGLQMPSAASVEGMGGGQGLVATQAPTVAQTGVLGAGAAPITASQATTVASPFKMALDAVKPYASLIGPATSLLGAATAQMPQMPQNAGARIPGVEAPPEARGLDRQAARSPILDVLRRNRRENRNPTLLTGPGGVSMESVRVGRNTLLGM